MISLTFSQIIKKSVPLLLTAFLLSAGWLHAEESEPQKALGEQQLMERLKQAYDEAQRTGETVSVDLHDREQTVENGDLARVDYTVRTPDGKVYATSLEDRSGASVNSGAPDVQQSDKFPNSKLILAGAENEMPAIGDVVVGMQVDESKHIIVPAEKCYGVRDEKMVKKYPKQQMYPKIIQMSPEEFTKQFQVFPIKNHALEFDPFLKANVQEIDLKNVTLALAARFDKPVKQPYGTITIKETDRNIVLQLEPIEGAAFRMEGRTGRIVAHDAETVSVDFNHPMASVDLTFDLTIRSVTKAAQMEAVKIDWIEKHDESIAVSEEVKKPLVMILYASWCSWSKKLIDNTMADPRVKDLKDKFVWAKVDSHANPEYKEVYGQDGFPMVVILSPKWEVVKKIDGYRKAPEMRKELQQALAQLEKKTLKAMK